MMELSLLSSTVLITEAKHSFDMWVIATNLLICILAFVWGVPLPSYFTLNINFICSTIHFVLYVHTSCNSCLCKWQVSIQWHNQEYQLLKKRCVIFSFSNIPLLTVFLLLPKCTWHLEHLESHAHGWSSCEIFFSPWTIKHLEFTLDIVHS